MLKAVIVDDEPLAREGIRIRFQQRGIEILEECADGAEAASVIPKVNPNLLFLDIRMPDMTGFDVLDAISLPMRPAVIFLSAHDEYALTAFEYRAMDYLLKPIDDDRFEAALSHASEIIRMRTPHCHACQNLHENSDDTFSVRVGSKISFIRFADVRWIEGLGDYAALHVQGRTHLVRETLTSLEQRLSAKGFIRVRRSAIVQVSQVRGLRTLPNRDCLLSLGNRQLVRVSRTYRERLRAMLGA